MFNFREIFKRTFKIYSIWLQAHTYGRITHTSAQCSPASVGLAQAHPNKELITRKMLEDFEISERFQRVVVTCSDQQKQNYTMWRNKEISDDS